MKPRPQLTSLLLLSVALGTGCQASEKSPSRESESTEGTGASASTGGAGADNGDGGQQTNSGGQNDPPDPSINPAAEPPPSAGEVSSVLVHPGMVHKKSDLDRMKYMVEANIEPWSSSFETLSNESRASFDYEVQGNTSLTEVWRDAPQTNKAAWESDSKAAYFNALMWYVTGDERHAQKAVQIFNAWTSITYIQHTGTKTLTGSMVFIMLEAAEIIKSTYDGWSLEDQKAFGDMLVYPGYSSTQPPDDLETQGSWYWRVYMGDRARAGNQELSGWRAAMAIGIFLDNEIIYDRAQRYVAGLGHRPDDMPYEPGPTIAGEVLQETPYNIVYRAIHQTTEEDWGYEGVLTHYILETGQCSESARDQGHSMWGINCLQYIAEMAWSQGDDLYGHEDSRLLKGLEYHSRYNLSYLTSYPDQPEPWEPTVENGEYMSALNRPARTRSLAINPFFEYDYDSVSRGAVNGYMWEMSVGHYVGRGLADPETDAKWITRTRDYRIEESGYERSDGGGAYLGYGALTLRRPLGCHGDPIRGFYSNGLPAYDMNVLPGRIEAEHYDYSPVDGEGRTYHDTSSQNSGGAYRADDGVDIELCRNEDYCVTETTDGEWLSYTVYVPETREYDISLGYAAQGGTGAARVLFSNEDVTGLVSLSATGADWVELNIAEGVTLQEGVQSMKIVIESGGFNLSSISIH